MSVTLYTTNWGGYWEKYGQRWTNCVNNLNTKPDKVVIISDEPIDTEFEVILTHVLDKANLSHFRNVMVDNCQTDFMFCLDLDDESYPNCLDDLNFDCDVHAFSCSRDTGKDLFPIEERYVNMFEKDDYETPGPSFSLIRVQAIKDVGGYPAIEFEDAGLWIELRSHDKKYYRDEVLRVYYHDLHPSLSRGEVNSKITEMNDYFRKTKIEYQGRFDQ